MGLADSGFGRANGSSSCSAHYVCYLDCKYSLLPGFLEEGTVLPKGQQVIATRLACSMRISFSTRGKCKVSCKQHDVLRCGFSGP